MEYPHFTRIERETTGGPSQHFVVHTRDPKLAIEFSPDTSAPDRVGQGVIRRISVPNSWSGQYSQYSSLISQAQAFFRASLAEPAPRAGGRFPR